MIGIRRHAAAAAFALLMGVGQSASADVELVVRVETGEVQLFNRSGPDVLFAGYTIESDGGALLQDGWDPISGRLDASGSGAVDAGADWFVFSDGDSTEDLSEGALDGDGGVIANSQLLSLGAAWDTTGAQDLTLSLLVGFSTLPEVDAIFTSVGDYDVDGDVDDLDYALFRATYGTTTLLWADGNGDGVVDAADYAVWRNALPASGPIPVAVTIPEPASCAMLAMPMAVWGARRRRGPTAATSRRSLA